MPPARQARRSSRRGQRRPGGSRGPDPGLPAMTLDQALTVFVALFVTIDPVGVVPLFVALTQDMTPAERRRTAVLACLLAFGLLAFFGLAGEAILNGIGISMSAFRIAGGLLLFLIAIDMLFEKRTERRGRQAAEARPDPTVFPLATPLIAGPGALAAMVLYAGQHPSPTGFLLLNLILGGVMVLCLVLFLAGDYIGRMLGRTGITVVTRLLGMLLAALAVQFVLDGLAEVGAIGRG
jgi:multiple antibiotic resistance protein